MGLRGRLRRAGFDVIRYTGRSEGDGVLRHILMTLDVQHAVDVGANVGGFGTWLRSPVGFTGRIDSYEPGAAIFQRLAEAAASDPGWFAHRAALSDQVGERTLNVFGLDVLSSLETPTAAATHVLPADWTFRAESVRAQRLADEPLPDIGPVFLKIDTQGHDWAVLRGAGAFLDRVAVLQMELSFVPLYESSRPAWESIRDLEDLGFALAHLAPVTRPEGHLRLLEADGLFVRA